MIHAEGAVLRGPCTVRLSKEQWQRRVPVLGPVPERMKPTRLDGGQSLQFKSGEEFRIEGFEGRLNRALFENLDETDAASDDADGDVAT